MPDDQNFEAWEGSPIPRFNSYADDTPRDGSDELRNGPLQLYNERAAEPKIAGSSIPPPSDNFAPQPTRQPPALWRVLLILAVVGAAVVVGWAGNARRSRAIATASVGPSGYASAHMAQLIIERRQIAPVPTTSRMDTPRLVVLSPTPRELGRTPHIEASNDPATASFTANPTARKSKSPSELVHPATAFVPAPTQLETPPREGPSGPSQADPEPPAGLPPRANPSAHLPHPIDCGAISSAAQDMICRDAGLVAADRRLIRAYAAALTAGIPDRLLARDQAEWSDVREDAANRSKQAVENLYHRRIEQLEAVSRRP